MNPQEALDAPRWQWIDGMKIEVEDDMKTGIAEGLGQFQAVTNLIDFAMNPQEALDAPRWQWIDGMKIEVEDDMKTGIAEGLKEKGHDIKVVSNKINMGRGQIILKNLMHRDGSGLTE